MSGLIHQEGCHYQERQTLKYSAHHDEELWNTASAASEGKEGDIPSDYLTEKVNTIHLGLRGSSQKAETWRWRGNERKQVLSSHLRTVSTDSRKWALGPWVKSCLSPAQAPMQKQQQSLAASNSACLTRSEWWRHWVPYWKSSGSSGPRSQPVAWNRKTQRADRLKGFYRAKNQGPLSLTELTKETTTMFSTPATHGSLPAKFLGFVSSWDLGHATFGHLRGSCLWIIWGDKFMCFIQVKEDALKAYFVLTSHIPTLPRTGHSWGLIFKEGISKDAHQSYLN